MKWEIVKMKDAPLKFLDGDRSSKYPKRSEFQEEGIIFLNANSTSSGVFDINAVNYISLEKYETITKGRIMPNDIILTTRGNGVGDSFLFKEKYGDALINAQMLIVRCDKTKLSPQYLYYYFINPSCKNNFVNCSTGSAQPQLPIRSLKEIEIKYPPLITQQKIAAILSSYDDLIENNLRRIKLLEEKAFLKYKEIVRSEKMVDGKIGDLAEVKYGYAFKGSDWTDEGFPVIKIKNIGNNDIDLNDCSLIPENIAESVAKFKLNAGDLLIAMTGATIGKVGMMPKTETNYYLNQRVGIFKPKIANADIFLFCFFNEPAAKSAVENLASGAAQPNISGGQIESIKLIYPIGNAIIEFGSSLKNDFELIWNLKKQNTKLREARDILLPRLMSGEIVV